MTRDTWYTSTGNTFCRINFILNLFLFASTSSSTSFRFYLRRVLQPSPHNMSCVFAYCNIASIHKQNLQQFQGLPIHLRTMYSTCLCALVCTKMRETIQCENVPAKRKTKASELRLASGSRQTELWRVPPISDNNNNTNKYSYTYDDEHVEFLDRTTYKLWHRRYGSISGNTMSHSRASICAKRIKKMNEKVVFLFVSIQFVFGIVIVCVWNFRGLHPFCVNSSRKNQTNLSKMRNNVVCSDWKLNFCETSTRE